MFLDGVLRTTQITPSLVQCPPLCYCATCYNLIEALRLVSSWITTKSERLYIIMNKFWLLMKSSENSAEQCEPKSEYNHAHFSYDHILNHGELVPFTIDKSNINEVVVIKFSTNSISNISKHGRN